MVFTVFPDQENAGYMPSETRDNNSEMPTAGDRKVIQKRSVLGVLDSKQPPNKRQKKQAIKHAPSKFEVPVPKTGFQKRKPLSDVGRNIQIPVKNIVQIVEKHNVKEKNEASDSSCVYPSMLAGHDKSFQVSYPSLMAHRSSSNIHPYACELYFYLRHVEKSHRPKPGYKQTVVTYEMRAILVDWLVKVAQEYKLQNETLYLAVSFVDRFLSLMPVVLTELQLLGIASMYVASKYEEIYFPKVSEFVFLTDDSYTKKQVLNMERLILRVLGFNISNPTTIVFLKHISVHSNVPLKVMYLAMYLGELCLLEANTYLSYKPSVIGSGSIALARLILEYDDVWPEEMSEITNYCLNDLIPILKHLNQTYKTAPHPQRTAIQLKYKSAKYHCISEIEFKDVIIPEESYQN